MAQSQSGKSKGVNAKLADLLLESDITPDFPQNLPYRRAADAIRNYPTPIRSAADARKVEFVGDEIASKIEQILNSGQRGQRQGGGGHSEEGDAQGGAEGDNAWLANALVNSDITPNFPQNLPYRRAAEAIRNYPNPIRSGADALQVEGVGQTIASKIDELLSSGKFRQGEEDE